MTPRALAHVAVLAAAAALGSTGILAFSISFHSPVCALLALLCLGCATAIAITENHYHAR